MFSQPHVHVHEAPVGGWGGGENSFLNMRTALVENNTYSNIFFGSISQSNSNGDHFRF